MPPLLARLVRLDFPDVLTTKLTANAAQRQLHLTAQLDRGMIVSVTVASDSSGATTVRTGLTTAAVQHPDLVDFHCGSCGTNATAWAAAARVTHQLHRVEPHLIALLGDGVNCVPCEAAFPAGRYAPVRTCDRS
jgi:hypothetical protein